MVTREQAGDILLQMVSMMRRFRVADHQRQTISGTKIGTLQHLKDGETRLGDLARHLSLSPSVVSRAVEALEGDGLVERRTDDLDARAFLISLTDHGRATVAARERHIADTFAGLLSEWTPADIDQASQTLTRLNDHLGELTAVLETDSRMENRL